MSEPRLIGLDWGTTSCRAYLIGADGGVLARTTDGPGILRVENGAFGAALDAMIGGWIATHGKLPVILSGMIGSRQGWVEAPYARCPAGADDIVAALTLGVVGNTSPKSKTASKLWLPPGLIVPPLVGISPI